ncbi:hypothetical protein BGZ80_006423 [Entomortierella chlamydospora]|uniref:Uncharacterized protein n=1 Tax=Entomortierella chlamydospora TaxID=101097 RepID=A0A9P6T1Z9_9FUNG|nr:hypothetical protein BGZ80_006423 [Entomortierella chlamydospora]
MESMSNEGRQDNPNSATNDNGNNKNVSIDHSDTDTTLAEHAKWALEMIANKKPITMPSFASAFDYYSELDAHSAYSNLISSSNMPQVRRSRLQANYNIWRNNLAEKYWAEREEANSLVESPADPKRDNSDLLNIDGVLPSIETPPAYLPETEELPSSQSLFEPHASSPDPLEGYLIVRERYILDMTELTGYIPMDQEMTVALSPIRVVEEHANSPKSIRLQLPVSCRDAIDGFLIAQDQDKRYYPPQATTDIELEVFTILSCLSFSHGPKTLADCCHSKNQEMNFIIHHISIIWNSIFNAHEGFSLKWDRRLNEDGLERPDVLISHHGVVVGCGEIKPFLASKTSLDEDRARLPEFMKRALHERIIQAQTESEFAVFGFFISGSQVEISLMRLVNNECLYKVYTGAVLSSIIGNEDSMPQLLARLYFVRQWIMTTIPTTQGPRMHCDTKLLRPTFRTIQTP